MTEDACLKMFMQMAQNQADAMSGQSKYEERCKHLQEDQEKLQAECEKWRKSALSWQHKYEKETEDLKNQIQSLKWQMTYSGMHITVQENKGVIAGTAKDNITK